MTMKLEYLNLLMSAELMQKEVEAKLLAQGSIWLTELFEELPAINFAEICEMMGWSDLQDGGLFEHIIERAIYSLRIRFKEWGEL